MRVFYTDRFVLPLPEGHKFPMSKYSRLRERVQRSGLVQNGDLREPHAATDDELHLAHDPDYVRRVAGGELTPKEQRRIGFPWSPGMVERSRRSAGATIEACEAALDDGIAVSLAGGTHHAFRDQGEGFCVFNDSVVAARVLQRAGRIRRAVVLDCDVHQGNGTAAICEGDDSIFTFSIHGEKNFPFRKEVSDLDVPLEDNTSDGPYAEALQQGMTTAIERSRPDVAFFLAGADAWRGDRWGRLGLTKAGLAERDRIVLDTCESAGIPVVVTMAGGYAPNVQDTVDIHYNTVSAAAARAPSTEGA
jgi:acetoin utilization deacetylase AcuC-like enzyme